MKRLVMFSDLVWKIIFTFVFVLSICEFLFRIPAIKNLFIEQAQMTRDEQYDPGLSRINSMARLEAYTDSLYQQTSLDKTNTASYALVLGDIIRKRFYHGYLAYSIGNNFLAMLAGKLSGRTYDAILQGDDILKFSAPDCRQQCLVMMELLRKKGYDVRGINLKSSKYSTAHFTFETFYNNSWHFSDPDMEPNASLLYEMDRPSLAELSADTVLLTAIYNKREPGLIMDLFTHYTYNKVNQLVPAHLYIFHSITKLLSKTAWFFCLVIYFFRVRRSFSAPSVIFPALGARKNPVFYRLLRS